MKRIQIEVEPQFRKPADDPRQFREAVLTIEKLKRDDGTDETAVRVSVSSETPYLRHSMWDAEKGEYVPGYDVLGHADGEIDFSRMQDGLVIQDTHWGDQIGIIREPAVKDGKLGGIVEFGCGARAQEIAKDAAAGIRRNMSVGYIVKECVKTGEQIDGIPVFRVTSWTPYEASFVNVPADTAVGVGRSMTPAENKNGGEPAATRKEVRIMDKPETKAGYTAEQKTKIREMASAAHVSGEEVADILTSERSFEEIREELLNRREKYLAELAKKPAIPATPAQRIAFDEGTTREIQKRYNLVNVIRALADSAKGERSSIDIGFEREISDELAQKTGRAVQGILLPDFVRAAANGADGSLTLGTPGYSDDASTGGGISGIGGAGKNTIATNLLAGRFIEALRDALVLNTLGAEIITGLVGDIAIPKGGSISGGWISTEGGNASKKNPTFGQITATPHTYGAYVDITRKLLIQSSVDVQTKVLEWLMYACAKGIETAAFQGAGSSGEPTGLATALNSGATAWSNTPTFDKLVALIAATRTANSFKPSMRFVGTSGVWSKLATTRDYEILTDGADTPKNVGAIGGSTRLLDLATNRVCGHEFVEAHCMPSAKLIFGDFSQLAVCMWSGTDITVDPYANSTNGGLRIVALQDSDILIKEPAAFKLATGVHS